MSSPKFTEQQAHAILTRGVSIALSAGAGCGKTFVLTQRFLQQLEPGPASADLSSLVAITFTDRAAREMRDRVREACHARLRDCDPEVMDHWLGVLRGLDTARISTIHSFCTSLLRANAVEAGLDPRFGVLEPPLADSLLAAATEQVVHRRLIDDREEATAFVLRFGLERTRDVISQLVRQRFRIDWASWDAATPDMVRDLWWNAWEAEFKPRLIAEFRECSCVLTLRSLLAEHTPDHAEMRQRWETLAEGLNHDLPWTDPSSQLELLRQAARVQGGGGKKVWPHEDVFEDVKTCLTDVRTAIDDLRKQMEVDPVEVERAAQFSCHSLALARDVELTYEQLKAQAGALDFDDLLMKARNLLRDSESVRQRFSRGIRLLMVDEFQDTDPVQADIVRDLCGAALRDGKLFLVGDIKQSIYRFRRADPQVFHDLRGELPTAGRMSLTRNFRSQPAILNFVNVLFRGEFPEYEPLVPFQDVQQSPPPCIEFLFADRAAQADDPTADALPNAERLREWEADWMARRIRELLEDETPRVRDRDPQTGTPILRRVLPGDITILFRALTSVQQYEEAFRRYGLDYYLVGGKAFFAQQEVYDILNLCRCLDDPNDTVALLGVLRSPMFGLSDDALQSLRPDDGDWWESLAGEIKASLPEIQRESIRFAAKTLQALRERKNRVSIAELLEETLARTGYDAALLAEFLGNRKVANLRKLIDQAASFDRSELFTLTDFIARLQESVLEETDEEFATTLAESGNVIRLMSIHQSKGLEFPVVIVADINRKSVLRTSGAYLHPDWGALVKLPDQFGVKSRHLALDMLRIHEATEEAAEISRLFYVAVTRAADHLILSGSLGPRRKLESPWMQLLASRFDLATGLPKGDPLLGTMVGVEARDEIPLIYPHREPPQATPVPQHRDLIRISRMISELDEATPEPLPDSLATFPPDLNGSATWSVSRLEAIDADLQPSVRHAPRSEHVESLDPTAAESLGNLMHAALQRFDFSLPDDWSDSFQQALGTLRPAPDAAVQEAARQMLARMAESEFAAGIAHSRQVYREVDFLLPWPRSGSADPDLISGQIDLCVQDAAGKWKIYDYKTAVDRGPAHVQAMLAPYTFQLGVYALALEAWLNQPVDQVSLVLLRPHIRELSLTWTSEQKTQIETRLTAAILAARKIAE